MTKLVGALGLAATGYLAAMLVVPYLPAGTKVSGLEPVAACSGIVLGWRVIGMRRSGRTNSYVTAALTGVRAAAYLSIWGLGFLGFMQMLVKATRMLYDGPLAALSGVLSEALDLSILALQPDVLAALLLGGVMSSVLAEWAGRRWR
ncbi:MAG: TrgA family protein [Paracoccaceae bacterium]|nr:TrgA family protein [Paracoccaceae bacterium]